MGTRPNRIYCDLTDCVLRACLPRLECWHQRAFRDFFRETKKELLGQREIQRNMVLF
jgi:hypothetical protein